MPVKPDHERMLLNRAMLREQQLDALVCSLPTHVLLLSGYWPITGYSLAILTADTLRLLTPTGEEDLVKSSWVEDCRFYELGSLKHLKTVLEVVQPVLSETLGDLKLGHARIGFESGPWVQPVPYVALSGFGESMRTLLHHCAPAAHLVEADDGLAKLKLIKTAREVDCIRASCSASGHAFERARIALKSGESEIEVASQIRGQFMKGIEEQDRADGFAFCMSGPNGANSHRFFQQPGNRQLQQNDLAIVHCNSHVNGYWTDVSRTFHLGPASRRVRSMYEAVFAARDAALAIMRPGVNASAVDAAARDIMKERGFGDAFKTPLGHGIGLGAIDHHAMPRLHPMSAELIQVGMVFNTEPGIYIPGECGMRHCDVIALGEKGPEILTNFQSGLSDLILP